MIRHPKSDELAVILTALNEEFIFKRGRELVLEKRFPGIFSEENRENLFALYGDGDGRFLSFVAAKVLSYKGSKVFFLGSVFTPEAERGHGYAGLLLEQIVEIYRNRNFVAGYLWTGIGSFYEKHGWQTEDRSVVLQVHAHGLVPFRGEMEVSSLKPEDVGRLLSWQDPSWTGVSGTRYFVVPPPADFGLQLVVRKGAEILGYLCGGYLGTRGYIYEINVKGLEAEKMMAFSCLFSEFTRRSGCETIWINVSEDAADLGVLHSIFNGMETKRFNLQMQFILAKDHRRDFENINIPFLDRI